MFLESRHSGSQIVSHIFSDSCFKVVRLRGPSSWSSSSSGSMMSPLRRAAMRDMIDGKDRGATMSSLPDTTRSLMQVFNGKLRDFNNEIDNVHMVWLEEIQQEANRMFSRDFSTEPELMPKTPSQKKTNRRKRVSMALNGSCGKRRFSKGKRSNLRSSSVQMTLNSISELVTPHVPDDGSESLIEEPVRRTRRNKTTTPAETEPVKRSTRNKGATKAKEVEEVAEKIPEVQEPVEVQDSGSCQDQILVSKAVVKIPLSERLSAESMLNAGLSLGRSANIIPIAASGSQTTPQKSFRTLVRRSLVGLRHSMTQEAVRRASRRSLLKKKARLGSSTCSSSVSEDICMDIEPEDLENKEGQVDAPQKMAEPATETNTEPEIIISEESEKTQEKESEVKENKLPKEIAESPITAENCRFTRSMARTSGSDDSGGSKSRADGRPVRSGSKRRAAESAVREFSAPKKKPSPPKKCLMSVAPHMRSFVHTVQKTQMLMTPGSLGGSNIMKSFIKQSASKPDVKERERQKRDALNKIEQENERKKEIEEARRKIPEEMKRKREGRLKRVVEARVKSEREKEQEKKKKIEEKVAQLEKKNDLLRVKRMAEEKAKRKVATKRQEEAGRQKKLHLVEEEERRHQEILAKRKAEEEREKALKLAEATCALELKKEQERERQAAAEKERLEGEAIALQKELERAARGKGRREMEEKRKMEEQRRAEQEREAQQKCAAASHTVTAQVSKPYAANMLNSTITKSSALNVNVDIENSVMRTPVGKAAAQNETIDHRAALNVTFDLEQSPQSYQVTPKGQKVTVLMNPEDYGMDQNSDDSTDDESVPRKPIPSWAQGMQLQQAVMKQYYHPQDLNAYFGKPEPPKLEAIFRRTKPCYFKRTSSAVWHSPPHFEN